MPNPRTTQNAKGELRQGYAPTTAAGEFVREEMHHQKAGKHGAESRRQAIAIGLSEARRAGLPIGKRPKRTVHPGSGRSEVSRRAARSKKGTPAARRGARKAAATRKRNASKRPARKTNKRRA